MLAMSLSKTSKSARCVLELDGTRPRRAATGSTRHASSSGVDAKDVSCVLRYVL